VKPEPLSTAQKVLLAAILAAAAVLRCEGLTALSLSHFDEGIYASSGLLAWGFGPLTWHPMQPLYSPPVFPWMMALGSAALGAFWPAIGAAVSATVGWLTVPLLFVLARRLKNNQTALAAAALLALSDLHIAFSRMVLTDALVTFWFVLAFYFAIRLGEALGWTGAAAAPRRTKAPLKPPAPDRRQIAAWTIALGATTALAWNTKYNGWMPAAIGLAATVVYALRGRWIAAPAADPFPAPARGLACFAVAAVLAVVGFLPWWAYVESAFPGGYAAVSANHRGYFAGPAAWPADAWRLLTALPALRHAGWIATLALSAAALAALAIRRAPAAPARWWALAVGAVLWGAALRIGADAVILLVAAAGAVPATVYGRWTDVLLAAWVGAFVVLAPLYHPYVRLLLPALPGAILLALVAWGPMDRWWDGDRRRAAAPGGAARWVGPAMLAAALAVAWSVAIAGTPFPTIPSRPLWQRWTARQSYRRFGGLIDSHVPADGVVFCQGQPALAIYCPRDPIPVQRSPFTTVLDQAPPGRPRFLALDFLLFEQPAGPAVEAIAARAATLELVASAENDLNVVALLDWLTPAEVARKLCGDPLPPTEQAAGELALPPALGAMSHDAIMLYRIGGE
jgi:4-amino-4-deoxy-L-arabinose transferase-like glycosyltransferase